MSEGEFLGFDFNRELHIIRNRELTEEQKARKQRRLVLKLHY